MCRLFWLAIVVSLGFVRLDILAQTKSALAQIRPEVEKLVAASGAEVVGVAVYDTASKQTLLLNERVSVHAASTMKLPVMMELFRLSEKKQLDLQRRRSLSSAWANDDGARIDRSYDHLEQQSGDQFAD